MLLVHLLIAYLYSTASSSTIDVSPLSYKILSTCSCGYRESRLKERSFHCNRSNEDESLLRDPNIECFLYNTEMRIQSHGATIRGNIANSFYRNDSITFFSIESATEESLNSMHFIGMPNLESLQVSGPTLHQCVFAAIPKIKRVEIDCSSGKLDQNFLSFGSTTKVVKFFNCLNVSTRFVCTKCLNRRGVSIIRAIKSGPMSKSMEEFQLENTQSCHPGPCADGHFCQDIRQIPANSSSDEPNTPKYAQVYAPANDLRLPDSSIKMEEKQPDTNENTKTGNCSGISSSASFDIFDVLARSFISVGKEFWMILFSCSILIPAIFIGLSLACRLSKTPHRIMTTIRDVELTSSPNHLNLQQYRPAATEYGV